ncbi:acyl-CoA dehydrogenase family protein [Pedobacter gandavensis]|uniref:acyl-CoA dehydrogenase family protein n=1 Tax=Pedobacter gandavensis TaxID=2679963 RepID=UPI002930CF24|nr:acyl-CoA dehydrogenase family protein [Pedobacter gandavensis]
MDLINASSPEFLAQFDQLFKRFDYHEYSEESMSKPEWKNLVKAGVLLPIIPKKHGGRENNEEIYLLLEKAAYYNLGLAMYLNTAILLFTRSIIGHGTEKLKEEVIADLLTHGSCGGFAVIEPETGTGISLIQTYFEEVTAGYKITGKKHWQCFSESADWWLIVAKDKRMGSAGDKFDLFVHKSASGGFKTQQRYATVGLKLIDFGLNEIEVTVPEYARLQMNSATVSDLLNLVISGAWGQWASLSAGFLKRIQEESLSFTAQRRTATGTLKDLGYVKYRLGMIASAHHICRAIFNYLMQHINLGDTGTNDMFVVQSAKLLAADYMFDAAVHYQALCGGDGYRYQPEGNISAYAMQDARAFAILGVANDILYELLAKDFLNQQVSQKEKSFYTMIQGFGHTSKASVYLESNRHLLEKIPINNTELVFAGKILARLFGITAIEHSAATLSAAERSAAIAFSLSEITNILTALSFAADIAIE